MSHLAENILSAARVMPEVSLLSPKMFLHLGSRAAVDKTLSRLTQEGKLLRQSRSTKILSNARPRPSMLMATPSRLSTAVNSVLVY